ncbi:unnamed protein product [Parnassius apollo]|uniref:(apollo) hypothetical protein n=1 Tax=Parnassius apollo TaxID=110799 RepID=A0A8S3WP84_PARAO|nr:unnamed protein product [Parnassius apollo]
MYMTWRVCELKSELKKRGASLRGRKADLVERLELYDQNFNFGNTENQDEEDLTMNLPESNTYRDINSCTFLPPLTKMHIRNYFFCADKKLDKAKSLYESRYLILARASTVGDSTFVKGYCKKDYESFTV